MNETFIEGMLGARPDESLLLSFVERVRVLTPSEWGRLDAIGEKIKDGSFTGRAEWLRVVAGSLGFTQDRYPIAILGVGIGVVSVGTALVKGLINGVRAATDGVKNDPAEIERLMARAREHNAVSRRHFNAVKELVDAAPHDSAGKPGDRGAMIVLGSGVFALSLRRERFLDAFTIAYSLVEPVIPFASLQPATAPEG